MKPYDIGVRAPRLAPTFSAIALAALAGVAALALVIGLRAFAPAPVHAAAQSSVLDGVYSAAQAERGSQKFKESCSACHNIDEMRGDRFRAAWKDQSLGDLFDFVTNAMPQGDPGSLKAEEYASIIAFFLNQSGYPAGASDLPSTKDSLSALKVLAIPAR